MRLLRQCLKGFAQHDEGQMRSHLFDSDNSIEFNSFLEPPGI